MDLKGFYSRFRAWQKEPATFKCESGKGHICANCGNAFDGDYCPVCGQKHDIGRASWAGVLQDLKLFKGVGVPSVLSFLLHMLGRPGYLIGDYVEGRQQVCSKPTTVLCFSAVFAALILNLVGNGDAGTAIATTGGSGVMRAILGWLSSHLQWAVIIETALLVFPTWLLFRFSPKHTRHTFPDGIYIQLFMGTLVLLFIVLRAFIADWLIVLVPIYYYIAYRQFFGYGVWGTLWRTVLSIGIIFYFFGISMWVSLRLSGEFWAEHSTLEFLSMLGAFILLGTGILYLGYRIGKRTAQ